MALADLPPLPVQFHTSCNNSRHSSWRTVLHDAADGHFSNDLGQLDQIDLTSASNGLHIGDIETVEATNHPVAQCPVPERKFGPQKAPLQCPRISTGSPKPLYDSETQPKLPNSKRHFGKWVKSITRRASRAKALPGVHTQATLQHDETISEFACRKDRHRKSSSISSFGFVSAVRNASISLASTSAVARTRKTARSSRLSRTDHSNRASASGCRFSEDDTSLDGFGDINAAAAARYLQRRKILEELVCTEEGYIGDVRFLMGVYVNLLAALPALPGTLRSSINQNLTEMLRLHDEILGELHRVIPNSEYTQLDLPRPFLRQHSSDKGHRRGLSLDALPQHRTGLQWLQSVPGMVADPQVAAEVAKIFSKRMHRFFIYKEYGAKYEIMIKDIASTDMTLPGWETYQLGLETLASSLGSEDTQDNNYKRSLTIGDLLVKPIQRVCRYPLLFAELLKCTPIIDCPNSHMEIETALMRLREATAEINRATTDDRLRLALEKTWLLQDRLVFPGRGLDAFSKNEVRSYGHIQLCGVLYTCWQTEDGVDGRYMICLLYKDVICLASASKVEQIYTIQACINLHQTRIETVDNGRGLQCRSAPFSWKLIFESDHQMYELIMAACTPHEETAWRGRLHRNDNMPDSNGPDLHGFLSLDIKSLGAVFGGPGTIARRMSIHRATTVGAKAPLRQIALKNTSKLRVGAMSALPTNGLIRSQSMLASKSRIPVLAPPRGERARLEVLLAEVWTLDILPLPEMTSAARNEQMMRRSASTMMRKLSVTGSLSKRTGGIKRLKRSISVGSPALSPPDHSDDDGFDQIEADDYTENLQGSRLRSSTLPCTAEGSKEVDWTRSPELSGLRSMEILASVPALDIPEPIPSIGTAEQARDSPILCKVTKSLWASSPRMFDGLVFESRLKENVQPGIIRSHSPRWLKVGPKRRAGHGHGIRNLFH